MKAETRKAFLVRKIHILVSMLVLVSIAAFSTGSAVSENLGLEDSPANDQETMYAQVLVNPDRAANCLKTMEMGDMKIAVLGSEGLDVTKIKTESVTVGCEKSEQTVKPSSFEYKDISGDGYTDLVMVLNCHEIVVNLDLCNCFCNEAPLDSASNISLTI